MALPETKPRTATAHVKGTIFSKVVKSLRKERKRSEPLIPEELKHYLDERILDTRWVPAEHYHELMRVLAQILPDPGMDVWEWMGRESARMDFKEVYRALLRSGDPVRSLQSFGSLWQLRHDTGTVTVDVPERGRATIELSDYHIGFEEIYRSIQGTLWQTLNLAGAKEIEITARRAPDQAGCRWQLSWR